MRDLFGTADARDSKCLAAVYGELHAYKDKMEHAADHKLT